MQIVAGTFRFAMGRELGWNTLRSDWFEVRGLFSRAEDPGTA